MKNTFINTRIILLVAVTSLMFGCTKDNELLTYDLTGDWRVVSFENYVTSEVVTKTEGNTWTQYNNGDITVNFSRTVISGKNVTNTFSGNYVVDQNGNIGVSDVGWTKMGEPEWGRLFHAILDAETYEIRDSYLVIFYNQKKNSITFEKI